MTVFPPDDVFGAAEYTTAARVQWERRILLVDLRVLSTRVARQSSTTLTAEIRRVLPFYVAAPWRTPCSTGWPAEPRLLERLLRSRYDVSGGRPTEETSGNASKATPGVRRG